MFVTLNMERSFLFESVRILRQVNSLGEEGKLTMKKYERKLKQISLKRAVNMNRANHDNDSDKALKLIVDQEKAASVSASE
ncbi:hypothetical protein ACFDTO_18445 [Microbacteriaceae bacterium 4G12]